MLAESIDFIHRPLFIFTVTLFSSNNGCRLYSHRITSLVISETFMRYFRHILDSTMKNCTHNPRRSLAMHTLMCVWCWWPLLEFRVFVMLSGEHLISRLVITQCVFSSENAMCVHYWKCNVCLVVKMQCVCSLLKMQSVFTIENAKCVH